MTGKTAKVVCLNSTLNHCAGGAVTGGAGVAEYFMLLIYEAEVTAFTPDVVCAPSIVDGSVAIHSHLSMACSARRGGRGHTRTHMTY